MKAKNKFSLLILMMSMSLLSFSQDFSKVKLDQEKVKKFEIYLEIHHTDPQGVNFNSWKENNKQQYTKEMWYFSESFYIKRNVLAEGIVLDEAIIDITRFENKRKENEEAIVEIPGSKDVIVLLPNSQLFYKPKY